MTSDINISFNINQIEKYNKAHNIFERAIITLIYLVLNQLEIYNISIIFEQQ